MDDNTILIGSIVAIAVLGVFAGIVLLRRQTQQRREAEHLRDEHRHDEHLHDERHQVGERLDVDSLESEALRHQREADALRARAMRARADELDPEIDVTDRTLDEQRDAARHVKESRQREFF